VNLWKADLRGADLREVDLRGTSLWEADLRAAQFDTNIQQCRNFEQAVFTADALPWLILNRRWADWKDSVRIEEVVERGGGSQSQSSTGSCSSSSCG
jgi:uncharacterized protein YjbI with pentapeptide repeats